MKQYNQDSWQGRWRMQLLEVALELAKLEAEAQRLATHLEGLLGEMEALKALARLYKELADDEPP